MFDFLKKHEEITIDDFMASRMETAKIGKALLYDFEHGDLKFNDDTIQLFIPVILNLVDFTWIDFVGKNLSTTSEYKDFKEVLDRVHEAVRVNEKELVRRMHNG